MSITGMDVARTDNMVRLKAVARSEGDGMESHESSGENSKSKTAPRPITTTAIMRRVPGKLVLPASSPPKLHHIVGELTVDNTVKCFAAKHRQPKFVPYEPYKGAVNSMVPAGLSMTGRSLPVPKSPGGPQSPSGELNEETGLSAPCCRCSQRLSGLEEELGALKQENAKLESQLQLQTQVNGDLKKLLVASVGEDMESRVHFLTEDKTKLAHDIIYYSQKLMDDSERLEKVSIQCDVWRSKFLASSVIVEELANWKVSLSMQLNEMTEIVKVLLDEHDKLSIHNYNTLRQLTTLKEYYENFSDKFQNIQMDKHGNALEVAKLSEDIASALHCHLVATNQLVPSGYSGMGQAKALDGTLGECMAKQVLCNRPTSPGYPGRAITMNESHPSAMDWARYTISGIYKNLMTQRYHPNTRFERLTFNCGKCTGDIILT